MRPIDADALRVQMYRESFETDTYIQRWDSGRWISYKMFENVLDNAPTIEPQRWIPVSEALPEDGVTVWVTIRGHDVIKCEDGETLEQAIARISKNRWVTQGYWSEEEHGWNDPSFGCPLMVKPIAWMPMEVPEPYKEGQDE